MLTGNFTEVEFCVHGHRVYVCSHASELCYITVSCVKQFSSLMWLLLSY